MSKEAIRLQATHQSTGFYVERCFPISDSPAGCSFESKSQLGATGHRIRLACPARGEAPCLRRCGRPISMACHPVPPRPPMFRFTEVGLDSSERLARLRPESGLVSVAMHGDYRYDQLRNTPSELREADARIREHLALHVRDTPLIVVGYSGRDESVMATLEEAYSQAGSGGSRTAVDTQTHCLRGLRTCCGLLGPPDGVHISSWRKASTICSGAFACSRCRLRIRNGCASWRVHCGADRLARDSACLRGLRLDSSRAMPSRSSVRRNYSMLNDRLAYGPAGVGVHRRFMRGKGHRRRAV